VIWQKATSPFCQNLGCGVHLKSAHFRKGIWSFGPNLIQGSLDPNGSTPRQHLDRSNRFLHSSSVCFTHRYTDHATCDIASNRPDLCTARAGDAA